MLALVKVTKKTIKVSYSINGAVIWCLWSRQTFAFMLRGDVTTHVSASAGIFTATSYVFKRTRDVPIIVLRKILDAHKLKV